MIRRIIKLIKMGKYERKYMIKKRYGNNQISSQLLTSYLLEKGAEIGRGTVFHDPATTVVDIQRPWMLHIGEFCKIAGNVTILTHDYSRSVLRRRYNDIVGEAGITEIGDNCFIGLNSVILMGTHIGNNCIVGAGSIVSGNFQDDVVIAGNPAHVIMSLDEFYHKRKEKVVDAAKLYCAEFYKKYNCAPSVREMGPFFPVFLEKTKEAIRDNNVWTKWNGDDENEIIGSFLNSEPIYGSYDEFLKDVMKRLE